MNQCKTSHIVYLLKLWELAILKNSRKHYRKPMSITMKTINTPLLILRMNLTNCTYNKKAIRVYIMSSSDYKKITEFTRFVYPLLKDPKLEVTVKQIRFCTTFVVNSFDFVVSSFRHRETILSSLPKANWTLLMNTLHMYKYKSLLTYSNFTACRYFQYSRITASSTFTELSTKCSP